jgi:hypothetical protein
MNNEVKKVKSQKNAAIVLIAGAFSVLVYYLMKPDFGKHGMNDSIICGALLVLIIIGSIALIRSLRKQKEQNV